MPDEQPEQSDRDDLAARILHAAVTAIGGAERPGQVEMTDAVEHAISTGEHLLVQAGTGTGKSLGYLAPAFAHLVREPEARVIVATATLALQRQLATKDVPVVLEAVAEVTGRRPTTAVLKGRSNYACLHRVRDQVGAPAQQALLGGLEVAEAVKATSTDGDSILGAEVVALREWAEEQLVDKQLADRDDAPSHTNRAWAQVSVPVRECLGVQRCPYGAECFVEESRDRARQADLVVTNHALLAIDAMHGHTALPEHDLVIVDEAHELVSRVTGAASVELSPQQVERVARRALEWLDDDVGLELLEAGEDLQRTLEVTELARVTDPDAPVVAVLQRIRAAARAAASQVSASKQGDDAARTQAGSAVDEVLDVAERMAALADTDVVYVSERERFGRWLVAAPLSVAGLLRDSVMAEVSTVLTSATLKVGGDFDAVAGQVGLRRTERVEGQAKASGAGEALAWRGLDVGSPFDYQRQGICYVAAHLARPSRDGISPETLAEVAELVWASGGGALGLFASQRSADLAAAHVRAALPERTVLCQGDAQLPELMRRFSTDPEVSLFGTLSLWQGIDVPGQACELVIIDKIPFPRPDDPLMLARQQHVERSGGNGFMQVAAAHAGLLLAQGAGRLIRRMSDRGVVAILDPRLVTARYGSYLAASLPPFWQTTDREVAIAALQRLAAQRATS